MNFYKTSCIVTTQNRAEVLKTRSLASLLGQVTNYPNEIIVVDAGSTDNTEHVVRKFQEEYPNLVYLKITKCDSVGEARNAGMKIAKGEYIVFLDDGDALMALTAELGRVLLDHFPEKQVVIGGRLLITPEVSQYQGLQKVDKNSLYTTLDDGFVMRKEVFNDIQYDENLLTNEDADFGIQFMKEYGFNSITLINNCFLLKYHVDDRDSFIDSAASSRTCLGMARFLEKNFKAYKEHYMRTKDSTELEYILRYAGTLHCQGGEMRRGIVYLWEATKLKPIKNILLLLAGCLGHTFFTWFWKCTIIRSRTKTI